MSRYTDDDREELSEIGSGLTAVIDDIAHHEVGDLSEGWWAGEDIPAEITRLRARLEQLADTAATGIERVRMLEIRATVREVWPSAWAAGRLPDHEDELHDLNVDGVSRALYEAEQDIGREPHPSIHEQIGRHASVRSIGDQVLERLTDQDEFEEDDSGVTPVPDEDVARADAVVTAFITAVYGEPDPT